MNSVFIPYIPSGITIIGLKNALEDHYHVGVIGIDMVQTERGYIFFAHFTGNLAKADVAAIDATSQYKLTTRAGNFFYVRRNTGTLDLLDPALTQFMFYGGNTYSCNVDRIVYTFTDGKWLVEWLPQDVIDMFVRRQGTHAQMPPLPALIV
jgi:hypothetical protein